MSSKLGAAVVDTLFCWSTADFLPHLALNTLRVIDEVGSTGNLVLDVDGVLQKMSLTFSVFLVVEGLLPRTFVLLEWLRDNYTHSL